MIHDTYRSMLFVPSTRPERIPKALKSGADLVIVDLEDAVALDQKDTARRSLQEFLDKTKNVKIIVRINTIRGVFEKDLALCKKYPSVIGVMLPKVEYPQQIEEASTCGKLIWPLIETARGLLALQDIIYTSGIERLVFGAVDMANELNLDPGTTGAESILDQCRYQLIICSRAAGLPPPIDSVITEINDLNKVKEAAKKSAEMGFAGMLSIHPRQIDSIHHSFIPNDEAVRWANRVLEVANNSDGAFQLDGQMIDAPVISRAKALLARARR